MFHKITRRRLAGAARLAFGAVVLTAPVFAASQLWAASKTGSAVSAAQRETSAWKTHAYSKTSEFSERLTLLEFSDKNDPACESTTKLLNEMRRKNYPIQRVEKTAGGDVLFKQYNVKTAPTLVLLFDGKEFGRIVVKKDDVKVTTQRLLTLFQKGRDAVAASPRVRVREPEYLSQSKPKFGFLFPRSEKSSTSLRAQAPDVSLSSDSANDASELSMLDTRTEEISNIIGETRLEASTLRVVVKDPNCPAIRGGLGAAIHYNTEYQEALAVVAASVFAGIADPISYPDVSLEFYNPDTNAVEKVAAQCVHCDPDAGVAFVAAQVDRPIKPVAFLPKKNPMEPGERAVSIVRHNDATTKSFHDVVDVDQRRFYENSDEQSAYVPFVEVSNPLPADDYGAGLFVQRNGRYYFAGIFVSRNAKGEAVVVPASVVSQALLVNRNLTAVYRDQIAGKFDAPASDAEIDSAIDRLVKLDAAKRTNVVEEKRLPEPAEDVSVVLSKPVSSMDENGAPAVDLTGTNAAVATREDSDRADVALGKVSELSEADGFPSNARNAFARSEAVANSISDNSAFQLAQDYRQAPAEPETVEPDPEQLAAARSQLAFSDRHVAERPATPAVDAQDSLDALVADDADDSLLAAAPVSEHANETLSAPLSDPLTDPLFAADDSAASALADEPVNDPLADPLFAADDSAASAPAAANDALTAPLSDPLTDPLFAVDEPAPAQIPAHAENLVAQSTPEASTSPYAFDRSLPTPNSDLVRSTAFSNREQAEAFNKEEEEFEAALDVIRRRGMEGAEIICIVNWAADPNAPRETEVIRVPRRTLLTNPAAPGAGVQLAAKPDAAQNAARNSAALPTPTVPRDSVPMTSNRPDARLYK